MCSWVPSCYRLVRTSASTLREIEGSLASVRLSFRTARMEKPILMICNSKYVFWRKDVFFWVVWITIHWNWMYRGSKTLRFWPPKAVLPFKQKSRIITQTPCKIRKRLQQPTGRKEMGVTLLESAIIEPLHATTSCGLTRYDVTSWTVQITLNSKMKRDTVNVTWDHLSKMGATLQTPQSLHPSHAS
jgi:hypothetical protein